MSRRVSTIRQDQSSCSIIRTTRQRYKCQMTKCLEHDIIHASQHQSAQEIRLLIVATRQHLSLLLTRYAPRQLTKQYLQSVYKPQDSRSYNPTCPLGSTSTPHCDHLSWSLHKGHTPVEPSSETEQFGVTCLHLALVADTSLTFHLTFKLGLSQRGDLPLQILATTSAHLMRKVVIAANKAKEYANMKR